MTKLYARARVTTITKIRRIHKLPRGSTPRVLVGQTVQSTETLSVSEVAHEHRIINLIENLRVKPKRVNSCLVKREGEIVSEGDILASRRAFLRRRRVTSPLDGRIIRIDHGKMLLEGKRSRLEVESSVPGKVIAVDHERHVIIEMTGAAIQIAWGHGGLMWGALKVMDEVPATTTNPDVFNIDHRGAIIAIGSPLTEEFLRGAIDIRVRGIIASSMQAKLLPLLDDIEFPVGLTQGFGELPMSARILQLLNAYNGREIALDMGMAGDWRERRPEIIIPLPSQRETAPEERDLDSDLMPGQRVRILQSPYMGEIATVSAVHEEPHRLDSGLWAPGADVEIGPDNIVFVPFANLEYLG